MSSNPLPLSFPRRLSLSAQVTDILRKGIEDGTWQDYLPSERRLCELLQVSRPTVRTALHLLAKEGALDIRQGRRNRLLKTSTSKPQKINRLVGIITSQSVSLMTQALFQGVSDMRAHFAEQGFTVEFLVVSPRSAIAQSRRLNEFINQNRPICCVLLSASPEIQTWFLKNNVPAVVLGSCHPGVALPSMDIDYRSVCRHAAGIFLGKGHRQIAYLVPNSGFAGDLASEEGFKEAVAKYRDNQSVRSIILRHTGTTHSIVSKLDTLLAHSHPPTGIIISRPQHVIAIIIYLLKRGLSVPEKVSIIARDQDNLFSNVLPNVAHYSLKQETFAHRLTRLIQQMVDQGGYLEPEHHLMFPRYVPGGTVQAIG